MDKPPEPADEPAVPPGSGRGRDLSRTRKARSAPAETGRKHHLGAAPEHMPVWLPDGTITTTRTSAAQLADLTPARLARLHDRITAEMSAAAAELDFEKAAHLRDEAAAVDAELARRSP
jgi:excinuclease UvrABC helicase subunit UvrB